MEYVDLGLPSGKKWAKCNLGANSEEEYGLYFAWGETVGYTDRQVGIYKFFAYCDYKFNIDSNEYNLYKKYNETDEKTILDLEDDAAYNMLGENWRMPTKDDFKELIENTTNEVISINNVKGIKFTSKHNSNYIFLPFAGEVELGIIVNVDYNFHYWVSNLTYENSDSSFLFYGVYNGYSALYSGYRTNGRSIRAIYDSKPIKNKKNMEYVDLGLPSGKKWAKCNLGANSEEESGLYYQWGDTQGYTKEQIGTDKIFNWENYKWNSGSNFNPTKYNGSDHKTQLDLEDDAVYAALGGNWRMPTVDDWRELYNNTTRQWTQVNGVNGYKLTASNGNYIFLPATGYGDGRSLSYEGSDGNVWSSSLYSVEANFAFYCDFDSPWLNPDNSDTRYYGFSVRGVYVDNEIKNKKDMEYVDLDLPSGKKWAKCNLGTTSEEETGLYYQWGDTQGYTKEQIGVDKVFDWENYKFGSSSNFSKYNSTDGKTVLDLEDDAVYAALGGNWRMPTVDDWRELYNNTTREWTQINGVKGYKLTSSNGNYIFLPAAGSGSGSSLYYKGSYGYVWSSSLYSVGSPYAFSCYFSSGGFNPDSRNSRCNGFSVRGVYVDNEIKNKKNMEYVDLGLPSGKKWAKCNLGATSEEESGLYYQWGDTVGYTAEQVGANKEFNWANYKWSVGGSSSNFSKYNSLDNKTKLDLEDDAAYVALGGNWRIPTKEDLNELADNTISSITSINGIRGIKLISRINGNHIFLPLPGYIHDGMLRRDGSVYIWSSEGIEIFGTALYICTMDNEEIIYGTSTYSRYFGHSIRPILLNDENEKEEDVQEVEEDEVIVLDKVTKEEATYPYYDLLDSMNDLTQKIPFMKDNEHIVSLKEYAMSTIAELDIKEKNREREVEKLVEAKSWFHVYQYSDNNKVGELYMYPYRYLRSNNMLFALVMKVRSFDFEAVYNSGIEDTYIDIYASPKNNTNEYGLTFAYKLTFEKVSEEEVFEKAISEMKKVVEYRMKKIKQLE